MIYVGTCLSDTAIRYNCQKVTATSMDTHGYCVWKFDLMDVFVDLNLPTYQESRFHIIKALAED